MAYEWLTANKRHVHGPMSLDEADDPLDERITSQVAELPERLAAPQVCIAVRVASGAAERALAGDLD